MKIRIAGIVSDSVVDGPGVNIQSLLKAVLIIVMAVITPNLGPQGWGRRDQKLLGILKASLYRDNPFR